MVMVTSHELLSAPLSNELHYLICAQLRAQSPVYTLSANMFFIFPLQIFCPEEIVIEICIPSPILLTLFFASVACLVLPFSVFILAGGG